MDDKLKKFLDAQKEARKSKNELEKRETLIELELYEKVYAPDNNESEEFSLCEWDTATATKRYYKIVPIDITDAEYEEVKKYSNEIASSKNNPIATALTIIACIIFFAGFIAGLIFGNIEVEYGAYYTRTKTEFSFAIALIYWCVSLISGIIMLGFAEIIKLLHEIKMK